MTTDWVSTLAAWARNLPPDEEVALICAEAPPDRRAGAPGGQHVRMEQCLQTLSAADLAEMVAATPRLILRLDTCGGPGSPSVETPTAVSLLVEILSELGARERLVVDAPSTAHRGASTGSSERTVRALPVRRRAIFPWTGQIEHRNAPSGSSTSDGALRRRPQTAEGHGEAREQLRLAQALREIHRQTHNGGTDEDQPDHTPEPFLSPSHTRPRSRRLAAEGCTGCATCARSCPTAALSMTVASQQSDPVRLTIDPAACIGCGHCIAVCPAQALTDAGPMSWSQLAASSHETLATIELRPCTRCRTPFSSDGDLCDVCRLRQREPFGSFLPPTYLAPHVYAAPPPG